MKGLLLVLHCFATGNSLVPLFTIPSNKYSPDKDRCTTLLSEANNNGNDPLSFSSIQQSRFPSSAQDQIRQAVYSIKKASEDGIKRHTITLLLPLIGATELDDWSGGARQQTVAATPLTTSILTQIKETEKVQEIEIDASDNIKALFGYASDAKNDTCAILLPTGDILDKVRQLEDQVGEKRDLLLINPQWKRPSDFSFFQRGISVDYTSKFVPTYHCSNLMVEGEQIRIVRAHPGPWQVYLAKLTEDGRDAEWIEIGTKAVLSNEEKSNNNEIFAFGRPTYQQVIDMIEGQDDYVPKSLSERAASAFTFIKDSF